MVRWALMPNVGGNRRADWMVPGDQGVYRRVRLTVKLGRSLLECAQNRVDACLVPRTLSFQPLQYVGVDAERY